MSTSHNAEYNNSNLIFKQQSSSSTAELRQRAHIDKTNAEAYDAKRWIDLVIKHFNQGDLAILNNDLENAYVAYMRGCSILVEIIPFHSGYDEIKRYPVYLIFKKRANEEILPLLEDLASRIDAWHRSQLYNPNNPYNTHFNVYPVSPTTTSVASYAFRPSHDPRNFPHYSLNDIPVQQQQSVSSRSSISAISQSDTNQLVQDMSQKLIISADGKAVQLPTWTSNVFPNILAVEPFDLSKWITIKHNPSSILLIDVRPRNIFIRGCVKHQWIIQIEPAILQQGVTSESIQSHLQNNPQAEQSLFAERIRFDLIVYYDQNSSIETIGTPTSNLRKALEYGQIKRPPMMLMGGFDAWQATVGERGVFKFSNNAMGPIKEKRHWLKSSNASASVSSAEQDTSPMYDALTGKNEPGCNRQVAIHNPIISMPQPLPTAPRKESMTTRYPELLSPTNEVPPAAPSPQQQDVRPVPPSYPRLHRRRTYIDNPFNGFTTTTSKLYDVPPMAFSQYNHSSNDSNSHHSNLPTPNLQSQQQQQRPSSAEPTVSISRPSALAEFHHVSANNIHKSPTSGTFSQLNAVVPTGTTGLKNLGNTCYMNSIIQCLSGTIPLARYFISGAFRQHVNRSNKAGTGGILVESFSELLRVMWSENYNFISPMTFRDALVRFAPQFSGRDQQDSQEFLMLLLDGLHEDMNQHASQSRAIMKLSSSTNDLEEELKFEKLPDWQASAIAWEKYLAKNTSIIVDLFQGQYRSRLTCLSCKQTSTTYSVFMSLSLPIPAKKLRLSSVTLYQCLDQFVKEETLDKEDAWKCPKCQKKRKALKQLLLTKLPDILLIHLKRFSMDGLFKNKLDATVKCPTRGLDLTGYVPSSMTPPSPQDRPSFVYDLYAVSNHYGSLTGGHYTACVRDGYQEKWHYFDDSKFSLCDENKVITRAAYNLFYVRSKVK